jgi:hypothetical protein
MSAQRMLTITSIAEYVLTLAAIVNERAGNWWTLSDEQCGEIARSPRSFDLLVANNVVVGMVERVLYAQSRWAVSCCAPRRTA